MLTLDDLRPGDLFENPPGVWYTREISALQGARGYHWGMFVWPPDLIVTESINKGTAITRYDLRKSWIYRIRDLGEVDVDDILRAIAAWGRSSYGMSENFLTAANYLFDAWLPQYPWEGPPLPSWLPPWPWSKENLQTFTKPFNMPVNCIQYVTLLARQLGVQLLRPGQLVIQRNLEQSPALEYLGEFQMEPAT